MSVNDNNRPFRAERRRTIGRPRRGLRQRRPGMILLVVLIVIVMLSLAAFTFAELMFTEHRAAVAALRQSQVRALADSGMDYIQQFLLQTPELQQQDGGTYNNAARFQGVLVLDAQLPRDRGRFCVISANVENGELAGARFGLEDDSARVNLNALTAADKLKEGTGRDLLMALPGMTEETADAILDWIDPDDEAREYGAELDHYSGLGYNCKNGALDTVEELLLVKGVTPELLYGADQNRNGLIDANEQNIPSLSQSEGAPAEADRGWSAYITLYSKERNVKPDGTPRIDLNNEDLQVLSDELSAVFTPEWTNFIIAYRQNGPAATTDAAKSGESSGNSSKSSSDSSKSPMEARSIGGDSTTSGAPGVSASTLEIDLTVKPKASLTNVLDLVGAKLQIKLPAAAATSGGDAAGAGGKPAEPKTISVDSPFVDDPTAMGTYLPILLDNATVNKSPVIPGRININQASPLILSGVPGMTEEMVDAIVAAREVEPSGSKPVHRHEHWLLAEGIVTLTEMKTMVPFITAGGAVHRAQVVGYFDKEGPAARIEVVVDASTVTPRVVFWRDISNLGRGYSLATLGTGGEE